MKLQATVVMLPTEAIGAIIKGGNLSYNEKSTSLSIINKNCSYKYTLCHLYITVSQEVEPIKEGDWLYDPIKNRVGKTTKDSDFVWINKVDTIRKIIATTDKLKIGNWVGHHSSDEKYLPQIHLMFINEYCRKGGIDKVIVEYGLPQEVKDRLIAGILIKADETDWVPKLNPDNTINISSIEEKMYSRAELLLVWKHLSEQGWGEYSEESFDEWIKENL